ncbi:MAG: GxxExxY protein [Sphingobacteriales bacterium]|nr:GxxExxY protein [Sphingobacteriales bacterium]
MSEILFREEVYCIAGYCMEVWKHLGYGFSEVVYKDAMELEFMDNEIPYLREDELIVNYKGRKLRHKFRADFIMYGKIIVEVKSGGPGTIEETFEQILNYLKAAGFRLGLIVNFGKKRLEYKRIIV